MKLSCIIASNFLILLVSTLKSSSQDEVSIRRSDFPEAFLFGAATSAYQVCVSLFSPLLFFFGNFLFVNLHLLFRWKEQFLKMVEV